MDFQTVDETADAWGGARGGAIITACPREVPHMHPLHYWPGTQKFLNPRTGRAPLSRVLIGWTN
eukprot:COSAG01_NODE_42474_length_439_cov_8.164706_1_plen_63_part_10